MSRVYCAAIECKYNSNTNICKRKEINLSEHFLHTVHEGIQQVWRCKMFEECEAAKQVEKMLMKYMEGGG